MAASMRRMVSRCRGSTGLCAAKASIHAGVGCGWILHLRIGGEAAVKRADLHHAALDGAIRGSRDDVGHRRRRQGTQPPYRRLAARPVSRLELTEGRRAGFSILS
jgi:hypothetical protein